MKYKLNGVIFEENCNLMYVGVFDTKHNPLVLSLGELLWLGATPIDDNPTEHYKCPSYYDNNNQLQNCTCGKCGEKSVITTKEVEEHQKIELLDIIKETIKREKENAYGGLTSTSQELNVIEDKINELIRAFNKGR